MLLGLSVLGFLTLHGFSGVQHVVFEFGSGIGYNNCPGPVLRICLELRAQSCLQCLRALGRTFMRFRVSQASERTPDFRKD